MIATNATERLPKSLFYNSYGDRVVSIYVEAATSLGATVEVCTLEKAMSRLTRFDGEAKLSFIINICAAFRALESEGVIQAVAALSSIPCFPCRGDVAIIAEEKIISKHIAKTCGFNVAPSHRGFAAFLQNQIVVRKPINGGDSKGIEIVVDTSSAEPLSNNEFAEPFIVGADVAIYCVLDPTNGQHRVINTQICLSSQDDGRNLLHQTQTKFSSDNYDANVAVKLVWKNIDVSEDIQRAVANLGAAFHGTFLFRVDGRTTENPNAGQPLSLSSLTFLELNTMPTIPGDPGWISPWLDEWSSSLFVDSNPISEEELALQKLLAIWHKLYVQSKSDDGNSKELCTNSPI